MKSTDEKETPSNPKRSEDKRFDNTVSAPILNIMSQYRKYGRRRGDRLENLAKAPDDNASPKHFPFDRRRK